MSLRTGGLVSLFTLAVVGAAVGCSSEPVTGSRTSFGGSAGSGAGAGSSGSGAASGGGGTSGGGSGYTGASGQGAAGGFALPDSSVEQDTGTVPTTSDAACAADKRNSTPVRKDIIVVFDTSSSMSCDTADQGCPDNKDGTVSGMSRIGAIRNAISGFVNAPETAEIRVGLDVFPPALDGAEQCGWDYSKLDIPIAPAKDNAGTFGTVLGGLTPHLNTPTEQVLTGAYKAGKEYITANPDRAVAVVLVTDGMPFACDNDKTGARSAALAKAAFEGGPSIETYVVGMGAVATLDAIALAGTGGATHYIEANADATAKILALLKAVSTAITCNYTIPTGGKTLDYGLVNVEAKVGAAGNVENVYAVSDGSKCAAAKGGWYYDIKPNPPMAVPTKITLCPETCDPLKATEGSTLQVLIGCATVPATIY
jgi:hypothetical protein